MNPRPPYHTLSPDQAAEELALLLDEKFLVEDKPIEFHHWKEANAQRVTDLQMWLMLHPVVPADVASTPEPTSAQAPAPVVPEYKEAVKLSSPAPKPAANPPGRPQKRTPSEKLATLVAEYDRAMEKVRKDPGNRKLRYSTSTVKSHMKALCRQERMSMPKLAPLPELPDPKPLGGASHKPQKAEAEPVEIPATT